MVKRIRVLPYKQLSGGAKALSVALGGKVLKLEGSGFKPRISDVIINWGNTKNPYHSALARQVMNQPIAKILNPPDDVLSVSNKLNFFELMKEHCPDDIPPFWTHRLAVPEDAYPVVCRTVLSGHSGEGIVIANTPDELVSCSLYVKYVSKKEEYRVHVGNKPTTGGGYMPHVIAVQQKKRRIEHENPNWKVRNHANGFIYARNDVDPPIYVVNAALRSLTASGLDFGAVDVIYNKKKGKAYVLEINTAPGLEGTTVEDYKTFFQGA
jgi:glutathione synthase/RimK-type ligase-like ATP-grasp enzyme